MEVQANILWLPGIERWER